MSQTKNNRRDFVKKSILGTIGGVVLAGSNLKAAPATLAKPSDLKLAFAGYTFKNFDLDETIKMIQKVDVNYLCIKDFHLPLESTDAEIAAFHKKLADANIKGYAVGPIYSKTQEALDIAFDYAKKVGVDMIVGIPSIEDLPYLDGKVKEYNIRFAIHNHGPEDKLYPNATVIMSHIKDLDDRIGMCFDIGHNMRDGHDPVADIKKYKSRIFDLHLKNVSKAEADGKTVELGRGVIDIPGVVKMLAKTNYEGHLAMEYEKDMKAPMAGIAESVGYYRGIVDTLG
ncbi:TIM barrel protein [Cyclobacterium sp. 1_MG-2023]|uniref:sugar phosphate isomerase/epimerase family protein n=1 Tax=Cyclobacterium sp. 1_MG-2023 TaxID=3062681 RepID=UPI0026E2BFC8|nr:TIM barrel protein [Cyclobacterium sp. 1_MG-2023]MDO6437400.1 TIM barrel protein [Cyclobacterium sp. 1_MG-2023]